MRGGSWTAERIDLLKMLWSEGETAAVIGVRLGGMSRSAVLGKVFRLRLYTNPAETPPPPKWETQTGALTRRRRSPRRKKRSQSPPIRITQHKSLLELTNTTCRWPHGRPGTDRFFFCGALEADLERGIPYCTRHMRRAYGTSAGRRTATAPPGFSHSLR